nr:glycoside hydrolase family 3 N-terminal domain-containing protein [Croceibacterium mercuriale]
MSSYTDLNDLPAAANPWLLNDVLRGQMEFDGWVVSDANDVKNLVTQHFARDEGDAAVWALTAGNNMEMAFGPAASATTVARSVTGGRPPVAVLDTAAHRILTTRFAMGLFENAFVDEARATGVLADPAHRNVAQEAAERALVLLKNDEAALPCRPGRIAGWR